MPTFSPDSDDGRGRRREVAIALAFVALSLVMVYLPAPRQQQVAGLLRSTVLRPFIVTQERLTEGRVQRTESTLLQQRLDSATALLTSRNNLVEENRRLRQLLGLARRVGPGYIAATLLRPRIQGSESMFLLDVGRRNGVRAESPVIVSGGLVGVVREVRGGLALGMDWTHPDFRVSAMSLDGDAYGIVEPRRGDFREEDRLVLTGTPYHTRLADGTQIVTSGRGGIYPRGIPIGTVDGLADEEGGWRKSYWIRPAVQIGSVTHVLVAAGDSTLRPADLGSAMLAAAHGAEPDSAGDP